MFKRRREQRSLFSATTLLPEAKRLRLERTWAAVFREKALPLIDEELFRHMFHEDNGRPNKPVQTVVGTLILKDMFDLTDIETLERLEFDLLFQTALGLDVDEAHCSQKTLHNFRAKLMASAADTLLFTSLTDGIIKVLGVDVGKQRLDSTHIISNIARLTRLGLFCETVRVFLAALKREFPSDFEAVPASWRKRYLKEDGMATRFGDAKSDESRRRLSVCARDVWRLVDRFRGREHVRKLEAYVLLERLLADQCETTDTPKSGGDGDADSAEPGVPVEAKDPTKVSSDSLQSPHDPDATYSGHKGKGYEVQIAETHGNENLPEIITYVGVTRSCESDERALPPIVNALSDRGMQIAEMVTDTTYGSAANVLECEKAGIELVSPVPGTDPTEPASADVKPCDFFASPTGDDTAMCPAGEVAMREERNAARETIRAYFDGATCARCDHRDACPTRMLKDGTRVLHTTNRRALQDLRRAYEQTEEFKTRYAARAGVEGTNSEMKRRHGLGQLRVRREKPVRLAAYLKAAACNVKRMLTHFVDTLLAADTMTNVATVGAN